MRGVPACALYALQTERVTSEPIRVPLNIRTNTRICASKLLQGANWNETKLSVVYDDMQFLPWTDTQGFASCLWDNYLKLWRNNDTRHIDLDR